VLLTLPVVVRLPFTVALLIVALTALIACAVTLPVAVRLPPISAPLVIERFAPVMFPVTVNAFNVRLVRLVIPANVPGASVPLNSPPMIFPVTVRLPFTVELLTVALTALIA
jgi:hypothetical protein